MKNVHNKYLVDKHIPQILQDILAIDQQITDIQNDITTIETTITNIQNDITTIQGDKLQFKGI
jgi:prefoldin subunit 5